METEYDGSTGNQDANARASDGHKLEDSISEEKSSMQYSLLQKRSPTRKLWSSFVLQLMKQENKKTVTAQELDKLLSRFLYY